ncbi:MAG: hypothetical protein HZA25_00295 [Candidatus Niyogibacteria bacterium]|nr:hypothetical protein [Candidatus Niyogibacteria bacterium]
MKFLLTIILLAGSIGIAAFGYFDVHAGIQDHQGGCALTASQGKDCGEQAGPANQLALHLNALRNFSTATFNDSLIAVLFLLSLLMVGMGLTLTRNNFISARTLAHYSYDPESFKSHPRRALLRWLTLHENSPSIL